MRQKINSRFLLIAVLAVLATAVVLTVVYYGIFQRQVYDDLQLQAQILTETGLFDLDTDDAGQSDTDEAGQSDEDGIGVSGVDAMVAVLEERFYGKSAELRVTWIDTDGTVLFDNDTDAANMENHADRPEVMAALENGNGKSVRNSATMNMNTFYYAVLLDNGTVLRVAMEARNVFSVSLVFIPVVILILVLIIVVCILLAHVLTKQLVKPIEEMAENLDGTSNAKVYKELRPFLNTIRTQHEDILAAAMSRQDFTANVSHELKTPLTAISGYAELIENQMATPEKQIYFAGEIRQNAQRLLSLINDIIRMSELDMQGRTSQVTYENFDLFEVAEECVNNLQVDAHKREVELRLEGQNCMMHGNRDMIAELVENLVQNAIRYNNPKGHVIVTVKSKNEHPVLIVEDNGIGIPKDEQERVFERFYRVDKSRSKRTGGTGLGLAIVKHIVALHDATIHLQSELGKGTRITVKF